MGKNVIVIKRLSILRTIYIRHSLMSFFETSKIKVFLGLSCNGTNLMSRVRPIEKDDFFIPPENFQVREELSEVNGKKNNWFTKQTLFF